MDDSVIAFPRSSLFLLNYQTKGKPKGLGDLDRGSMDNAGNHTES